MPPLWPCLLLLIPAVALAREDFRSREVAVVWLAVLGICAAAAGWLTSGLHAMLLHTALNICLLVVLGVFLTFYRLLRRSLPGELFTADLGLGDTCMALALAPLFDPVAYVRLLLAAGFAALAWWCVRRPATIPLAGFMALSLVVYVVFKTAGLWR